MASTTWTSTSSADVSLAANYQGNAAPVTGDTLELNSIGTANLSTNLGYFTNVLGLTMHVTAPYIGQVGVETTGTNAATYLKVGTSGTTKLYVGRDAGSASGGGPTLLFYDGSTGTSVASIYRTGAPTGPYPPVCLKGSHLTLNAYGGSVGFAVRPGEVGTLDALSLLKQDGSSEPTVRIGRGTVWPATVYVESGTLVSHATNTLTALEMDGRCKAYVEADSTGAITGVDVGLGSSFIHKGTGAVATATVRAGATLDYSQDSQTRALDAVYAMAGAIVNLDNGNPASVVHSAGGTNVPIIYCPDGVGAVKILAPAGMSLSIR